MSTKSGTTSPATSNGGRTFTSFSDLANFLWSIADLLRGTYKQADYGKVILPMTVLRRLDCVLDATKPKVLEKYAALKGGKVHNLDPILNRITGVPFNSINLRQRVPPLRWTRRDHQLAAADECPRRSTGVAARRAEVLRLGEIVEAAARHQENRT